MLGKIPEELGGEFGRYACIRLGTMGGQQVPIDRELEEIAQKVVPIIRRIDESSCQLKRTDRRPMREKRKKSEIKSCVVRDDRRSSRKFIDPSDERFESWRIGNIAVEDTVNR